MPTSTTIEYFSVNGQIIGEKVGSNPRTDYLTDALGSVTATVDQSGHIINEYRYKPYGAQLSKTGAGPDPAFRWVGSAGYRQTGLNQSDVYAQERHLGSRVGAWLSAQHMSPGMRRPSPYSFAAGCPTFRVPGSVSPAGGCTLSLTLDRGRSIGGVCDCETLEVDGVKPACCWNWHTTDGCKGFIVQFVSIDNICYDCKTGVDCTDTSHNGYTYWEAWEVDGTVVYGGYKSSGVINPSDCMFFWPGGKERCKIGDWSIIGVAAVYDGTITWPAGSVPEASGLPSTKDKYPTLGNQLSTNVVVHGWFQDWSCCGWPECKCPPLPDNKCESKCF